MKAFGCDFLRCYKIIWSRALRILNGAGLLILVSYSLGQNSESNAQLIDALAKAQERQIIHGDDPTSVEESPSFANREDEIKWKLNKAKKTLHKARQLESLAKKAAVHFGYYTDTKQRHGVVSDLLSNAEDALLEAGDKMGFDYQKF